MQAFSALCTAKIWPAFSTALEYGTIPCPLALMQHLDISVYTFEKLADVKYGVIGIKYRRYGMDELSSSFQS